MATSALILVKLEDCDKQTSRKIDLGKIPSAIGYTDMEKRTSYYVPSEEMKKRIEKRTPSVELNGNYIAISVHWDGYIEGVGIELLKNYPTYEDALNLCLGGDCSAICKHYLPYVSMDNGGTWEGNKPQMYSSNTLVDKGLGYNYLFEDGHWYVACNETNRIWTEFSEDFLDSFKGEEGEE